MNKLDILRQKLLEKTSKSNTTTTRSDGAVFPFWNVPEGASATIRFLPDNDPNNPFFWAEKHTIKLPFQNGTLLVPSLTQFGKKDPIKQYIAPFWHDPATRPTAQAYYPKVQYVFGVLVVSPGFDEKVDEGQKIPSVRRVLFTKQLFEIVKASLMDAEMEDLPVDFDKGRDFRIRVINKGGFRDYSTSVWSMRSRALTEKERADVAEKPLTLSNFVHTEPDQATQDLIFTAFKASLAGEIYDAAKFGLNYPFDERKQQVPFQPIAKLDVRTGNTLDVAEQTASEDSGEAAVQLVLNKIKRAEKKA